MKRERSVRFRLTVWYGLVLFAALGLFSGLVWLSLRARLSSEVDRDLADRAARFQTYLTKESAEIPAVDLADELEEFCQALPPTDYLELSSKNGFEFHYPARPVTQNSRTIHRQFRLGGNTFELRIGSSLGAIEHTLDLLRILLFSLVPLVVGMACAGGAWLSGRALRPVDAITTAARGIGIDNLSLRLRVPQTGDELQRLTEAWNVMLGRLEAAVKTLSQFAADASHELRTPLAVIRTSAELALRRARSPESYRNSLLEIADEAEHMTRLVDDLLLLARNDANAAEMPREPLDLEPFLDKLCGELAGIADARGIRLRRENWDNGRSLISGNPAALRRLFLALLDNAIKYSHAGSEVIVAIALSGGNEVMVTVEDFGIGIGAADRPHIFQRFHQADKARTDGGFGLGLALAQSIAKAHGTEIHVTSEERAGSKFRIVFQAGITAGISDRNAYRAAQAESV